MQEFWNTRYRAESYAYGKLPNSFFAEQLVKLHPGKILLPADGEGRNAVFAAKLGWKVTSFDISQEGKRKAERLAEEEGVSIEYLVSSVADVSLPLQSYDAIGLIFAHFPADSKSKFHHQLIKYLKPEGTIIFEGFGTNHLQFNSVNPKVGGPKELNMLFSTNELRSDFSNFQFELLTEEVVNLDEGIYHLGKGSVVRCIGKKRGTIADAI